MAISRRAGTGSSAPLMCTISRVPSTAVFSTSRAVDSLSITLAGGATDPIRCAIPTCSPDSRGTCRAGADFAATTRRVDPIRSLA